MAFFSHLYIDDRELVFTFDYESIYPPPPRADESFALLKQIGAKHLTKPSPENYGIVDRTPESEHLNTIIFDLEEAFESLGDLEIEERRTRIKENRDSINLLWSSFSEDRAILEKLAAFEAIGDLSSVQMGQSELVHWAYRDLAHIYRFKALLYFADENTDRAIGILTSFIETNQNLFPRTRHLITGLTCIATNAILINTISEVAIDVPGKLDLKSQISQAYKNDYDPVQILEQWVLFELIAYARYLQPFGSQGVYFYGAPKLMPNDCLNSMAQFYEAHTLLIKNASIDEAIAQADSFQKSMEGFNLRNPTGRKLAAAAVIVPAIFLKTVLKNEERVNELIDSLSH